MLLTPLRAPYGRHSKFFTVVAVAARNMTAEHRRDFLRLTWRRVRPPESREFQQRMHLTQQGINLARLGDQAIV